MTSGVLDRLVPLVRRHLPDGVTAADLEAFIDQHRDALEQALAVFGLGPMRITWYASGTNHPGEIRGWASAGQAVGVTWTELNRRGVMGALEALAGTGVRVFLDSGAFAEADDSPIAEAGWRRRLVTSRRLARSLGPQLAVVAPDRVGDPVESERRLARWAEGYEALVAEHGAELVVPMQRGAEGMLSAWQAARRILHVDFTPAVPGNKAAASDQEIAELLREARPARLHVLGMGPRNRRAPKLLTLIALASPGTAVSMDSNRRRALVGRQWRAPLTLEEDRVADELRGLARAGELIPDAEGDLLPDYTDAIAEPSGWMGTAERKRVAREAVPRGLRTRFVVEPDQVLGEDCAEDERPGWCWELEDAIEHAWSRVWARETVAERKARGIRGVVG